MCSFFVSFAVLTVSGLALGGEYGGAAPMNWMSCKEQPVHSSSGRVTSAEYSHGGAPHALSAMSSMSKKRAPGI